MTPLRAQDATPDEDEPLPRLAVFSVSVARPQKLAIALGYAFAHEGAPFEVERHGVYGKGWLTELEIGTGAGKVGAGYFVVAGAFASASGKIVAMRTWRDPWGVRANETFIGPEITARVILFRFSLGYLIPVTNDARGTYTVGFGIGL